MLLNVPKSQSLQAKKFCFLLGLSLFEDKIQCLLKSSSMETEGQCLGKTRAEAKDFHVHTASSFEISKIGQVLMLITIQNLIMKFETVVHKFLVYNVIREISCKILQ